MSKESITKGVIKYSISTWVNLVVGFLSVIVTTRLLSPDTYGVIAIFMSASTVLLYIVTMGLDGALLRFYNEPPGNDTKEQLIYKVMVVSTVVCLFTGVMATFLAGDTVSDYIFGYVSKALVGLLFLNTFVNVIMRYLNISFRMSFKARQYTLQNILINCLARVLTIIAAFITNNVYFIITILVLGMTVVMLFYLTIQRKEYLPIDMTGCVNWSLSFSGYRDYFKYAIFSAPTYIVAYLNIYLGQQIIKNTLGTYDLGIYSSVGMFVTILGALQGGFATYWSAYVYKNYNEDTKRIRQMHDYSMIFIILVVSAIVMARDVIYLFIGSDFHSSKTFFSLLLFAPSLSFLMQTTAKGIEIAKKNHLSLLAHIFSVITNVVLCVMLTKTLGLSGAAFANVISAIVLYAVTSICAQKYYKTIDSVFRSIMGLLLLGIIILIPFYFENIIVIIFSVLIIDAIAYFFFRKEIRIIFYGIIPDLIHSVCKHKF